jgi:3-phenylpropionate/cinnamic acid dioxygenase small subunit
VDSRSEIEKLLYLYAERIDTGDFEGLADLFSHAVISYSSIDETQSGREEVLAQYRKTVHIYPDGTPRTRHVTTNVIFDLDEAAGSARTRSYFTVFQQTDALPLQAIIAGRYQDSFERVDGSWRFRTRHIISEQFGELRHHLTLDPEQLRR